MAEWTAIADSNLEPNAPIRSVDGVALRDNPIAITEGAAGAPRNQWDSLSAAVKDYILASSGLHALGGAMDANSSDRTWWDSFYDSRGFYIALQGAGTGVSFANHSSRSITFVFVAIINKAADDPARIRLEDEDGNVVVTSAENTGPRNTIQELQVSVTQAPGTNRTYTAKATITSGSSGDAIYYRGATAYIPAFF